MFAFAGPRVKSLTLPASPDITSWGFMRSRMLRSITISLALIACAGIPAFSQITGAITGIVRDVQTGEPLPGGGT